MLKKLYKKKELGKKDEAKITSLQMFVVSTTGNVWIAIHFSSHHNISHMSKAGGRGPAQGHSGGAGGGQALLWERQ